MTSEELLSVLDELAENVGDCLYDWDVSDLERLHNLAVRLTDTCTEVIDNVTKPFGQAPEGANQ
jgi:hypothetical protein